jgi:hypothetical protein
MDLTKVVERLIKNRTGKFIWNGDSGMRQRYKTKVNVKLA